VVGNLHTAALVSRHGSVDWACLPRFASASVFGRLLDLDHGGSTSIRPAGEYRSRQSYLPDTCVLRTEFRLDPRRRLELTDCMPVVEDHAPEGTPMIVRQVRAFGGRIPVRFECAPAFDYGRAPHRWRAARASFRAVAGRRCLELRGSVPFQVADRALVAEWEQRPGAATFVELCWGPRREGLEGPSELLERTLQFWPRWVHAPTSRVHAVAHRWHRWVTRSELTLKLLSHADTGAFVAAPTTSLPEVPGGHRNWDYRYVWIRDAAFAAQAMLDLGHLREARAFLRWVLLRVRDDASHRLRVVYGAHGETDLRERELPHWSGLWDSRPVRIGNAAAGQFQLDIYGELLDAALLLDELDTEFVSDHWPELAAIADVVVRRWRYPDRGIWEVRGPPRQFVHSKLMAWVALDRAARLAERHGPRAELEAWTNEAQKVRAWILAEGVDPSRQAFRQAAGSEGIDAANLRFPLVGFLPFDDPSVLGTISSVIRELAQGPFVYRYRTPDGLVGAEGTFLPAAFWLVECLARAGRKDEALDRWRVLLRAGTSHDLFSEEFEPATREMLGNFPQALTHVAVLRAAIALGEGDTVGAEGRTSTSGLAMGAVDVPSDAVDRSVADRIPPEGSVPRTEPPLPTSVA
jgi:GH15 family glucan-1,4-alpha-glucosidase